MCQSFDLENRRMHNAESYSIEAGRKAFREGTARTSTPAWLPHSVTLWLAGWDAEELKHSMECSKRATE